jgi:hypothetical protein
MSCHAKAVLNEPAMSYSFDMAHGFNILSQDGGANSVVQMLSEHSTTLRLGADTVRTAIYSIQRQTYRSLECRGLTTEYLH